MYNDGDILVRNREVLALGDDGVLLDTMRPCTIQVRLVTDAAQRTWGGETSGDSRLNFLGSLQPVQSQPLYKCIAMADHRAIPQMLPR
jgi:hypothetical protein